MAEGLSDKIDVAIAGGSIAGLCAGNALLTAGYDAHIFERSGKQLTSRGAGIVVQPDLLRLLSVTDAPPLAMTGCSTRQTVSGTSGRIQEVHMPQQFTSWEAIHASLLAAFPDERYHVGTEVTVETVVHDGVSLRAGAHHLNADIFVAADGFRSKARARFAPDTLTRYAGYIAWRGVVDEADLPGDLIAFFDDTFSFCEVEGGGHALCYLIPGEGGSVVPGTRRLNWVWYVTIARGADLDAMMTDNEGRHRDAAVPAGHVNEVALAELHENAHLLDPHFADLILATAEPFIQSILDVAPPAMTFGRVCLSGDAAFVVRPHAAAATAKAAADALALSGALQNHAPDIDRGLDAWDRRQVAAGRRLVDYGVMLGERSARRRAGQERFTSTETRQGK